MLGQVDLEKLIEKHLSSVQDWERNFKALKARGKESERLPRYTPPYTVHVIMNVIKPNDMNMIFIHQRGSKDSFLSFYICIIMPPEITYQIQNLQKMMRSGNATDTMLRIINTV